MTSTTYHKLTLSSALWWLCYLTFGTCLVYSSIIYALSYTDEPHGRDAFGEYSTTAKNTENQPFNTTLKYQPQEIETINYDKVKAGSLFLKSENSLHHSLVQSSDFDVEVTGMLARITLIQTFINQSEDWVEGIYVFPLTQGAGVDQMHMQIGERVIEGEIKERNHARNIYKQARFSGKKASLVEQHRPNLFTTSVANVPPGETIKVKISYLQQIPLTENTFSLRLPLTITPRYIPSNIAQQQRLQWQEQLSQHTKQIIANQSQQLEINTAHGWSKNTATVSDAQQITPRQVNSDMAQNATINVRLNVGLALSEITSPYHQISQRRKQQKGIEVIAVSTQSNNVAMNRDFVLNWKITPGSKPTAAYFSEQFDDHQYAMIMVNPPQFKNTNQSFAKEMLYVIDTSGSMGGAAIAQAKRALAYGIEQLTDGDRFNIIEFNSIHSQLFTQSHEANARNKRQANHWISGLSAGGGTEMYSALQAALISKKRSGYIRQVVFITDGSVGNEQQLFSLINKELSNSRLHTVGIGSAPNSHFMERSAQLGRGTYSYIGKIAEVQAKMGQLFNRINNPMLTDITINWPNDTVEVLPERIADLYAGEPLIINARWPLGKVTSESANVTISGQLNNQQFQQHLTITKAKSQSGVATWWARQKIKQLTFNLHNTADDAERESLQHHLTDFAIKHHLLSKYTSFIAVEKTPSRVLEQRLKTKAIANAMPKGTTQAIPIANTATSANLQLQVGLLMLLLTLLLMAINSAKYQRLLPKCNDEKWGG